MTIEDELIAHIADDPHSDAPRLVLADYYVQQNDPRGELMSIQLATQPLGRHKTRLKKLIREHGPRMVGTLADILAPDSLRFERGRLFACATRFWSNAQRVAARGNPLWATVVELTTDDAALIVDPMMRSVRTVGGFGISALAAIARGDRPLATIEELRVHIGSIYAGTREDRIAIGNTRCLPNLRRFTFALDEGSVEVTAQHLEWLLDSALGQQLERFTLRCHPMLAVDTASFEALRTRRRGARPLELVFERRSDSRR